MRIGFTPIFFYRFKKNIIPLMLTSASLALSGCALTHQIDDIDLLHYVHHVYHYTAERARVAEVSIKPYHSDKVDEYTFTDVVWESEYYDWSGFCEDYPDSKYPEFNSTAYSILSDDIAKGYVDNKFDENVFSFNSYYEEGETGLTEENQFIGRYTTLFGEQLIMRQYWKRISYSSKTPIYGEGEEGEIIEYSYEDYRSMNIVCEQIYNGELLKSLRYYIGGKGLYVVNTDLMIWELNENYQDGIIDYLEYKVYFR